MKPRWQTPKLVVLFRNKGDENVLAHCKSHGVIGAMDYNCVAANDGQKCESAQSS
jgi:hypothetical protein